MLILLWSLCYAYNCIGFHAQNFISVFDKGQTTYTIYFEFLPHSALLLGASKLAYLDYLYCIITLSRNASVALLSTHDITSTRREKLASKREWMGI